MMDELLTTGEAARRLGIDPQTIRKWTNDGRLRCVRTLGGHRRFWTSDINRILGVEEDGKVDG